MFRGARRLIVVMLAVPAIVASTCSPAQRSTATWDGLPAGFTADGHPALGAEDAPVTLEEWSDYLCPFCARHFRQTDPQIRDAYLRTGKVRLVFRDLPLAGLHPTAIHGHIAANCAGEQGPAQYWAMHDQLFSHQGQWNRLPDPGEFLTEMARGLALDMDAWQRCVANPETRAAVNRSVSEARSIGLHATPSFRFIGPADTPPETMTGARPYATFSQQLDARLPSSTR